MTKAVTKKEETALAKPMEEVAWGTEGIDASDVVIPKLLLMQGQSEFVAAGKAKAGDIVRSTNGQILGGTKDKVEIIPFMTFKTWVLSEKAGSRYEYRGVEPVTAENVNAELEWHRDGKAWRRDRSLNFYVLLPSDIAREIGALEKLGKTGELPDPEDALLPCVLGLRRTSYGAGKDLVSHFAKAASFRQPPAVSKFNLCSRMEKNDQGTFYIYTVEPAGKSTEAEIATCKKWYDIIKNTQVKVDESEYKKQEASPPPARQAAPRGSYQNKGDIDAEIEHVF